MTATVIDLDAHRPIWQVGTVRCFACGHQHVSVHASLVASPRASRWLQCPACWRMAGACVEIHEAA